MLDIHFYRKIAKLKRQWSDGTTTGAEQTFELLEQARSPHPVVYSIETTNACNMTCGFCPRTTHMTRPVKMMDPATFDAVASQLKAWSDVEWQSWCQFAEAHYGVAPDAMSENHFFLYIIPKVVVLHGYGDPLLDKLLGIRIAKLSEHGVPTYFSCNPTNINVARSLEMFSRGLDYVKYSIDSVDDFIHRQLRGRHSDFSGGYHRIVDMLDAIEMYGYQTKVVITMIDLGRPNQLEEYERLKQAFEGYPVYIYLKSEDNQWIDREDRGTQSIHWGEFCQFPWSSVSVMAEGAVVPCMQDYDSEMRFGHAAVHPLEEIWNGKRYRTFRRAHVFGAPPQKCAKRCDMQLAVDLLTKGSPSDLVAISSPTISH